MPPVLPVSLLLFLLLAVGAPIPAQAQTSANSGQTLQAFLPDLVTSHDRILAAAARVDSSRYLYRRAWAGWYPQLSTVVDGGYEYVDRPGDRGLEEDDTSALRNVQIVRLRQLLYDFGRTGGAIGASRAKYEQADHTLEAVRQEVLLAGGRAYIDVHRAWEVLGFSRRSEQNIKQQTGIEEALVQRGAGLSSDVLQAKSQLSGAQARRFANEGDLRNSLSYFKAVFMREPSNADIQRFVLPRSPKTLLPANVDQAVAIALEHNPRLLAAQKGVEVAESDVGTARSRFFPVLEIASDAARRENEYGVSGVRTEARALVELRYDLFAGGADKAALNSAKAERVSARRGLDDLRRQVEQQARTAWSNHQTALLRTESLANQVNILHEFLELARKERRLGKRTLLDVLSGEIDYINAQSNYAAARAESVKASFELLHAMGRLTLETLTLP